MTFFCVDSWQNFLEDLSNSILILELNFHSSIKFLDVIVKLQENEFVANLCCQKTDCHQYFHYHSEQMKKSSVYSQGLRI